MKPLNGADFWKWFAGFSARLPQGEVPVEMGDELLTQLHRHDERIYYELAADLQPRELILTGCGDRDVVPVIETLVAAAPAMADWKIVALKPSGGFSFTHRDHAIEINAQHVWFQPLQLHHPPQGLGLRLGIRDAQTVRERQTLDTGFMIVAGGLGERAYVENVHYVELAELPDDPESEGYMEIADLRAFLAWRRKQSGGVSRV